MDCQCQVLFIGAEDDPLALIGKNPDLEPVLTRQPAGRLILYNGGSRDRARIAEIDIVATLAGGLFPMAIYEDGWQYPDERIMAVTYPQLVPGISTEDRHHDAQAGNKAREEWGNAIRNRLQAAQGADDNTVITVADVIRKV
jgi:hypothetical protein